MCSVVWSPCLLRQLAFAMVTTITVCATATCEVTPLLLSLQPHTLSLSHAHTCFLCVPSPPASWQPFTDPGQARVEHQIGMSIHSYAHVHGNIDIADIPSHKASSAMDYQLAGRTPTNRQVHTLTLSTANGGSAFPNCRQFLSAAKQLASTVYSVQLSHLCSSFRTRSIESTHALPPRPSPCCPRIPSNP
ncbi:hypothetical protein B0J13DRAFT_102352 [Dactylonectria estremocensis]|uniref:Secreted protein n=1 Tax=Dactylonectria estremocensis TaxID=1079267 RepID=A0A9P9IU35_9HYPO|nr:hypothetical protein B0J13DRAFT_102352 [Dactylonectria estremocensis]